MYFRWNKLSEDAKKSIEDCDLVMDGSGQEYTEEDRIEEERVRNEIQRLSRLKRKMVN